MPLQEDYSAFIVRPPIFSGDDFIYWKGHIKYFLKTYINTWIIIKTKFTLQVNKDRYKSWTPKIKRQVEADVKTTQTLHYDLTKEELNRVSPFISAKDIWDKLVELHERAIDANVTKHNPCVNKLTNVKMQDYEQSSEESNMEEPTQASFLGLVTKAQIDEPESDSESQFESESKFVCIHFRQTKQQCKFSISRKTLCHNFVSES